MFESLARDSKWPVCSLGDFLRINKGCWISIDDSAKYRILGVISYGGGVVIRRSVSGIELTMKQYQVATTNQLMWCKVDTKNGAFGVIKASHAGGLASSNMCLADIDINQCLPVFLQYFFQLPMIYGTLTAVSLGTTNRQYLKPDELLSTVKLHLPPLSEQRRIVARIDELAAKIEEAHGLRKRSIEEFSALLQAGKRACLGDQVQSNRNCPLRKLRKIADMRYGISAPISKATDPALGVPIIRMANINLDGFLDLSDMRYYPANKKETEEFQLHRGDLLLNWRSGSEKHVGKTAIFDADGDFLYASFLLRIRVHPEFVMPEYLKTTLNFMRAEGIFLDAQRFQVNTKLNASEFGEFGIMLPPLEEQRRIVTYLNGLQAKAESLKRLQAETDAELDAMLPSILDKAFKGELLWLARSI